MQKEELTETLKAHKLWIESDGKEGRRANLTGANLREADLRAADLREADLRAADLQGDVSG